jgi:hypothetical protein
MHFGFMYVILSHSGYRYILDNRGHLQGGENKFRAVCHTDHIIAQRSGSQFITCLLCTSLDMLQTTVFHV